MALDAFAQSGTQPRSCAVCGLHADPAARQRWEIGRDSLWLLRHHPDPAPLEGWLLLDAVRHLGGPVEFSQAEARQWGGAVQRASVLVRSLTGCDRVYAIAFGEGARHLHLHLIPRHADQPGSEAWAVADLYREVTSGIGAPVAPERVASLVAQARRLWEGAGERL